MNLENDELKKTLAAWLTPLELRAVQTCAIPGGLSGAKLWQVTQGNEHFCLRQWPTVHPTAKELTAIHGLITHVCSAGLRIVPLPRPTIASETFFTIEGHLWELSHWLPGQTREAYTPEQMASGMETLARFHIVAASYSLPKFGPAPGLQKRRKLLMQLREGLLAQLEQATRAAPRTQLRETAQQVLADIAQVLPVVLNAVERATAVPTRLQWCLRDVHKGNLLFTGNQVTGVVDFGAAAIDSLAGDVARLVGSLAGGDSQIWQMCLKTYTKYHPLTPEELHAVAAYDAGGVVAAATNWLRWLFVERREFADAVTTQKRLDELASRLKSLGQQGGEGPFHPADSGGP